MTTAPPVAVPVQNVAPRRRRRWRRALACLLVLLAIPVIGYFYLRWSEERDLQAAIAEIDAVDPRWRFEDLLADRPPIADAQNPALVVAKVALLLRPTGFDIGAKNPRLFDDMSPVHRLNERQIEALRTALDKHADALKLARTLKDFPGEGRFAINYHAGYMYTNIEPLQDSRFATHLLYHDAMLRAEDEDMVGAMESCRAVLVVARSIGDEPILHAAQIRYAWRAMAVDTLERVLAQGEPAAVELQKMQELLAKEIEARILLQALRGECGGYDALLAEMEKGNVNLKMADFMGGPNRPSTWDWEAWWLDLTPIGSVRGRAERLRLMTETVEAAKLPSEQQQAAFAAAENKAKARASSALAVRLLMPGLGKVPEADRRTLANLRCALVGVAAERYRLRHEHWPNAIADLVADGLLKAVPRDPYDGQPLRYKMVPDGVVIYAVGPDGVDNGGAINRNRPDHPGTDQGFQLWDVRARRQAPLPAPPKDAGGAP